MVSELAESYDPLGVHLAAHITTTDLIGNAVRLLLRHPERWTPRLLPQVVEETLRYESPVPTIVRLATRAAVIGGVEIPAGADVLLVFASANRDEERFPDGDRCDATRAPSRHFGFGAGVHTCAGAGLARARARIALAALPGLTRDPDRPVAVRRSINVRGPLALPVRTVRGRTPGD